MLTDSLALDYQKQPITYEPSPITNLPSTNHGTIGSSDFHNHSNNLFDQSLTRDRDVTTTPRVKGRDRNIRKNITFEIIKDLNQRPAANSHINESLVQGDLKILSDEHHYENSTQQLQEVINLPKIKLISIKSIPKFTNLTILRLADNFLSNVDEIQYLTNLIWLDLHNNQISNFPRARYFWRNLQNLMVLNLHDNLFNNYTDVQSVSGLKNLIALTVYNTPMTVENAIQININKNKNVINYRHQLVNSCFNLKALDQHIISDEEIIEHLVIDKSNSRFKSLSRNLKVNLCPSDTSQVRDTPSYNDKDSLAYSQLQEIIDSIDYKLKHSSPIQIIQRYTRGFLARKQLGQYKKQRKQKEILEELKLEALENKTTDTNAKLIQDLFNPLGDKPGNLDEDATIMNIVDYHLFSAGPRPPTTSRVQSAKHPGLNTSPGHRPTTRNDEVNVLNLGRLQSFDNDWLIKLLEKLQYEIEKTQKYQRLDKPCLFKKKETKYESYPLKTESDTQNWIDGRTQVQSITSTQFNKMDTLLDNNKVEFDRIIYDSDDLPAFRSETLEIVGQLARTFEFDCHSEKYDLIHLAKLHKKQLIQLDKFVTEEKLNYIKKRQEKCQQQKSHEIMFHKNKILTLKENEAMLNAIKPLIKIAKERYRQNQLTKLQTQQNIIKSTKNYEEGAIANNKSIGRFRAEEAKENENYEQALISLALNDNDRRDKLYMDFASKRAHIWRMKARAAKETIGAGKKFAAETASLSRSIIKHNFSYKKQATLAEKQTHVARNKDLREQREQKVRQVKNHENIKEKLAAENAREAIEHHEIYKLDQSQLEYKGKLGALKEDFVIEPTNFLSPRRGSINFVGKRDSTGAKKSWNQIL